MPIDVIAYADSRLTSGAEIVFADVLGVITAHGALRVDAVYLGEANRDLAELVGRVAPGAAIERVPDPPYRLPTLGLIAGGRRRFPRGSGNAVGLVNLPSAEYGSRGLRTPYPSVGILHVPHSPSAMGARFGRARDGFAARAVRRAGRLMVVHPGAIETAADTLGYPRERIDVLPIRGAALERVPATRARAALSLPNGLLIGVLGRLNVSQKAQDLVVRALADVRDPVALALAGEGADREPLLALARELGLEDRVHLLGHADPGTFLSAIDLLAIPSRFEGLPLVALEARSIGTPILAAAVDGLVGLAGVELVPEAEPAVWARRLEAALTDARPGTIYPQPRPEEIAASVERSVRAVLGR